MNKTIRWNRRIIFSRHRKKGASGGFDTYAKTHSSSVLARSASAFLLALILAACDSNPNPVDLLLQAEITREPIPMLSKWYPDMDVDGAYRVQKAYVEKKLTTGKPAGFKAALTSKAGRRRFGPDVPVAGVLFASGRWTKNERTHPVVHGKMFRYPIVETEIGFVLGEYLMRPIPDVATLKKAIRSVVPIIELPDLGFTDKKHFEIVDLIAANAAARGFIVGKVRPVDTIDPNTITVTLSLDGREINRGKGTDAYGDQWQAALWLVNTMIEQGWNPEPGQILITGALGKIVPGKPGRYKADYGELGSIVFEIL
uniref:2-keto-4-pentenoate hydratase n=1 Tax=Candidatus Kentrum sp. FW TaxID=2126338 RepID=A0A450U1I5_9GAMM|nr:MAG: 2-keto-4-pentenoate hydratase [Candidatus Kentron sp. FW]